MLKSSERAGAQSTVFGAGKRARRAKLLPMTDHTYKRTVDATTRSTPTMWGSVVDGADMQLRRCCICSCAMPISLVRLISCILWLSSFTKATSEEKTPDETCTTKNDTLNTLLRVPRDCSVVMAPSDLSGWGLFAIKPLKKDSTPLYGDVVIPVSDPHPAHAAGMHLLIHDYLWDSTEVGQQYEGQHVMSILPGAGMLANGHAKHYSLLAEREPSVNDGGVTRQTSPLAGSFTLHHNLSFYLQRPVSVGEELLVTYGESWFRERDIKVDDAPPSLKHESWLRENGYCVDSMKPGVTPNQGRGAFATRALSKDSIVAPVPVLPLARASLQIVRQKQSGELLETKQLALNYCYGHPKSSLLLYPYSPIVNLINHSSKSPNVNLQWAENKEPLEWSAKRLLEERKSPGLLLELVALRDIQEGEEILLDYGEEWQQAWNAHVQQWKPTTEPYLPSFNVSVDVIKTEKEQRSDPYPDNIFTSCFYRYRTSEHLSQQQVSMDEWKDTDKNVMELKNLRPCAILEREGIDADDKPLYTVQIRNRFGLSEEERISKGKVHVVTNVPRHAIRFSDKLYTTDPYLEGAFRHEIGLLSFPTQWLDA